MSKYLGDFPEDATVYGDYSTKTLAQVPATLAGSPVLKVAKNGDIANAVTTGVTHAEDVNSVTGYNTFNVVTTNAYYATGNNYSLIITTGTVDSISVVGTVVREFSIKNRSVNGIRKNTAFPDFALLMIDSSDDVSGKTGLTVTATRRIDDGSFSSCANSVSEIAAGAYSIDLAASDLNGDSIMFRFTADGANDSFYSIKTDT